MVKKLPLGFLLLLGYLIVYFLGVAVGLNNETQTIKPMTCVVELRTPGMMKYPPITHKLKGKTQS